MSRKFVKFLKIVFSVIVFVSAAFLFYYNGYAFRIAKSLDLLPSNEQNYVKFLDVGQGDCALINDNDRFVLIDAGIPNDDGDKLLKQLFQIGVRNLDAIVVSHTHEDHVGGISKILDEIKTERFICDKSFLNCEDFLIENIKIKLKENDVDIYNPNIGECLKFGNTELYFISAEYSGNSNDDSLVFTVTQNGTKFFFSGDMTSKKEKELVQNGVIPNCDVYKAAHHGSAYSSSNALLEALKPSYCVVSCGKKNGYNFPSKSFLSRMEKYDITVYTTAKDGVVTFYTAEKKIKTKKMQ